MGCSLRDQELKIEEGKLARRKVELEKRQQQKFKKNTEVIDAGTVLKKKPPKKSKNKGRRIITQESTTHKVKTKLVESLCISKTEEFCMFCLGKRQ